MHNLCNNLIIFISNLSNLDTQSKLKQCCHLFNKLITIKTLSDNPINSILRIKLILKIYCIYRIDDLDLA